MNDEKTQHRSIDKQTGRRQEQEKKLQRDPV